ncbi:MAG: HU family DNA-binding protein, partial [Prevotella sp.]|nr:HU family DNA-binding protein [Prevotella sp.]
MGKISDLATFLSNKHNIKQKDAEKFISQMFELLGEELKTDKLVKVKGLGTFKVTTVKNRASVDVNTGERIIIEGRDKISFTPDASMKNLVNKPFAQFETVILKDGVDFAEIDKKYDMEEVDEESTETEESVDAVETIDEVDTVDTNEPVEETTSEPVTPEPIEVEQTVEEVKEEIVEDKNENVVIEEQVGKAEIEEKVETKEVSEESISPIISTQEFEEEDEEEMKRSEELAQKLQHTNNIVKALC